MFGRITQKGKKMSGWSNHGRNDGQIFPGGVVKEPNFETVLLLPLLVPFSRVLLKRGENDVFK
jgi:hypothetical protein